MVTPQGVWRPLHSVWRSSKIISDLKKNKIELYHGLSNELPVGISKSGIKSVVTIHDLIFLRHPEFYPAADKTIYHRKSKRACAEADHIIAVSEQTKEDLIHYYQLPEEKISVIYQSIQPLFFEGATEEQLHSVRKKFYLISPKESSLGKFILYVGTIEERKNLLTVLKAMEIVTKNKQIDLVVVGRSTPYEKKVKKYLQENAPRYKTHFLQNVSNEELRLIYQSAAALVYPSAFEGFGLPIAEAMASGIPVIANDEEIFREAGGELTEYVDVNEPEDFSESILNVIHDASLRRTMIEEGKNHAAKFKPERQAEQLAKLYANI